MEGLIASLGALFAALSVPIMILNSIGGIFAGIWLLVIGKWILVLSALISTIISTWILGLLMAPTLILVKPLEWATKRKNNVLVFVLGAISSLWTYVLMLLYGVGSFIFVFSNYDGGMMLPYLILAYAVSTSPWVYMASNEIHSGETGAGTLVPGNGVCIASIVMIGSVIFYGDQNITALVVACAIPLVLAWVIQMTIITFMLQKVSKDTEV